MFAVLAAICFFLVVIKVKVVIDLIALGLCFLAIHLIVPVTLGTFSRR